MTIQQFYEHIHGDYQDFHARMPSDALILRFVRQFPSDTTYLELMDAVQKGDITQSFLAAHKLKGLAANLAFSALFEALSALSAQLRAQTEQADPALVQRVSEGYRLILREINRLEADERLP